MNSEAIAILSRIEVDLARLRKVLGQPTAGVTTNGRGRRPANANVSVPVLKDSYSVSEAEQAKEQVELAFQAGLLTYDKKRGMKASITKLVHGWTP